MLISPEGSPHFETLAILTTATASAYASPPVTLPSKQATHCATIPRSPSAPARGDDLDPIVIGSHTDTVAGGGQSDGTVGVLAGIEIVRGLGASGLVA